LGDENAVEVHEGKARLNRRLCWVDAWTLEQVLDKAESLWREIQHPAEGSSQRKLIEEALKLSEKAIEIYNGNFLTGDEDQAWTVSYRERLRGKFLNITIKLSDYFGQMGEWNKAVEYCHRALEMDDLAEEFYQQMMLCYQQMGQPLEAINVYRRCRNILSANLGIQPSPKTEALYQKITEKIKIRK
jgi:DNA-binding SARP family transcriptional activator